MILGVSIVIFNWKLLDMGCKHILDLAIYVDVILAYQAFEIILSGPFHEHAAWNAIHSCKIRWIHIDVIHLSIASLHFKVTSESPLASRFPLIFSMSLMNSPPLGFGLALREPGGLELSMFSLLFSSGTSWTPTFVAERLGFFCGEFCVWCRTVTCWRV